MKKVLLTILALSLALLPVLGTAEGFDPKEFEGQTLNVYNWGEYVDMSVIRDFEKLYNVRVNYKTYESNEYLWLQLTSEDAWDVIVPSDYMAQRLIGAGKVHRDEPGPADRRGEKPALRSGKHLYRALFLADHGHCV